MMPVLAAVLVFMLGIMTAGWLYQRRVHNAGWADVFWTYGTGAACAAVALLADTGSTTPTWRQCAVAAFMVVWALRLGGYVAARVRRGAEDVRYAGLRVSWGAAFERRLLLLMLVQAPATALLALSVSLAAHAPSAPDAPSAAARSVDVIGLAVMAAAMIGESVADHQMRSFKAQASTSAVCEAGLWGWSRHPNYFFEWSFWVGLPILGLQASHARSWLTLAAPLVMLVLLRWVTGVPPLEAALLRTKGDAYRGYQRRVSAFLPRPPRR